MHDGCCDDNRMPQECGRCNTPMVKGHGLVCALHRVSTLAFIAAIVLLAMFWACLLIFLTALFLNRFEEGGIVIPIGVLSAVNSALLMGLSLLCGTHARWLRHKIVSQDENYLDADGSCCGGACAGSCGENACDDNGCSDGDCGKEGCSPEGCDDPDCCKKGGESCETEEVLEEQSGCCGGGCCK